LDNLIGYPLVNAINIIEESGNKIINIKKIIGSNKKFNDLHKPYVIREYNNEHYVTLYVSYY